ncbi:MarR family transcriptional regulator [Kitasatospora sp. NPDC059648]|uniref:MarR family transcriptional regulator n=1 Tax=Kitasatospora sp. NPDC059648 TaxID=3346894 RepID=UPI00368F19AC
MASLHTLTRRGQQPSQRQLADHTGLEALYISKLARTLESADLLTRTRHPNDPRAMQLSLTEQDAIERGWPREVERHTAIADRVRSLLADLGESPDPDPGDHC